jgi:hypothetical protein
LHKFAKFNKLRNHTLYIKLPESGQPAKSEGNRRTIKNLVLRYVEPYCMRSPCLQKDRQLEFLRETQEKFYDELGLPNAKELEKISEKAGGDVETALQRNNTILTYAGRR